MDNQLDLFSPLENMENPKVIHIENIPGLTFIENYISEAEEHELMLAIDAMPWLNDLQRRVQHYGYKYDYRSRRIDLSMKIGNLPNWIMSLAKRLHLEGYFQGTPDQLIINEYQIGQGISPHIDCEPCFEDTIVSISLNSPAEMHFTHSLRKEKIPLFLKRRSAVILQGDSRYVWKHSIPGRKSDKFGDKSVPRGRRVSLTFRKVII